MVRLKDQNFFTYITCNPRKTVLYTGMTNDLEIRIKQHYLNRGKQDHFASKFYCYKLLYYETYSDAKTAIEREKEIKDLSHDKKLELIKTVNPLLQFITFSFEIK